MTNDSPLRLAVISTPRSGNNWLQHLLSTAYDLPRLSPDTLQQVEWSALPARCVLILHWPRVPALVSLLRQHDFQVVVLARHPCDVLISILQFCLHHDPDRWLEGAGGNERSIVGALPTSLPFLTYATGSRAAALLSVSSQWWPDPEILQVRYEDLLADPHACLERLIARLAVKPRRSIQEAVETNTLANLRRQHTAVQHHFWRGQAGTWRSVIPATQAGCIAAAHADIFAKLGYACDADPTLDDRQAEVNWYQLNWSRLVEDLQTTRSRLAVARAQLAPFHEMGPVGQALVKKLRGWAGRVSPLTGRIRALLTR
jgi:hypothetical protein